MSTTQENYQERRAFPRHPIRDNSAVMLSPDNIISFNLLNISKSGLAFCYNGKGLDSKLLDKAVADFFGENIGAVNIPIRIISDTEVDKENVWFSHYKDKATIPYLRRCGIKFKKLSKEQELAIDKYIQSLG